MVECVTGASVHTPRQRNSTYVHTVRRSIYETIWPEHSHLPIRQYKKRPQGPSSRPRYMESCPGTDLLFATSTSTSTFMAMATAMSMTPSISNSGTITKRTESTHQEPGHCHIRYMTLAPSLASVVFLVTVFDLI